MLRDISRQMLLGTIVLALGGCAASTAPPAPHTVVSTDEFTPTFDINGPTVFVNPFFGIKEEYNLVTHVDKKTHAYTHVIETQVLYDADPVRFQFASDDNAQALQLIRVARSSSRICNMCEGEELFNIVVPDASLRAHAASGYRVKVSSRLGQSIILTITPEMIGLQYDALDRMLNPSSATAAAVPGGAAQPQALPTPPILGIDYEKVLFTGDVVVLRVKPASPAASAGLQPSDVLVSYNGHPINSEQDVRDAVAGTAPGSVVTIEIKRNRAPMTLTVQM